MIKTGDLVYRKQHRSFITTPHDYEIWLVLGKGVDRVGVFADYVRIQNVPNGNRIQIQPHMLMKIETDKI